MRPYLLLTPGPLTTSETVKEAMMSDWCTWDEDYNVGIVEVIRKELVELASSRPEEYTAVLMQGSGSFCVEATLGSVVRPEDHLLVAANGAYGKRMGVIADYYHLNYHLMKFEETQQVDPTQVDAYLNEHPEVTHVSVVHCETTTGVLNPLESIAEVVKRHNKVLIVDAMSSFGGVPIDMAQLGIDFMISSANKCIQGVPGFGFILARRSLLEQCKRRGTFTFARSLRPMGNHGKRTWKMAFYLAYSCGARLHASSQRTESRRRHRRTPRPL